MADSSNHKSNEVPGMIEKYGPAAAAAKIKAMLEEKSNIPLHIGITGESGTGKSTFVNAFRGIDNRDDFAAPTGAVETTMELRSYPHPKWPNVQVWDLPGIGTTNFPAAKYLEYVKFKRYDFFIIISAGRFKENEVKLALEIQRMQKKFYFVRSKIDDSMRAEERSQKGFRRDETLAAIRKDSTDGLAKAGIQSPQVFLVSSFERGQYDFTLLEETLQRELPAHKGDALLLAMTTSNVEIINKKKAVLQSEINSVAWLSALAGAVPVLSVVVDLNLLAETARKYKVTFGLDDKSLQNLAQSADVPLHDLRSVLKSRLALEEVSTDVICAMLEWSVTQKVGEDLLRYIPIVGTIIAGKKSFHATEKALNDFLNGLAEDAVRVFKRALNREV